MHHKKLIPWRLRQTAKTIWLFGRRRYCPVCRKYSRKFLEYGIVPRCDARCPWCRALERHRLIWRYFEKTTNLFDGKPKAMLHVAPEGCFEQHLKRLLGNGYLTADLLNSRAMEKMDITDIQHPDDTFDVIYCSHVLEHVPDDRKAMAEFRRVLKSDGWAILLVPITADETYEDPSVTDPEERLRLFGRHNHVRRYGPDYSNRLQEAGFGVKKVSASDFLDPDDVRRIAVDTDAAGDIFHCTK